MKDYAIIRRYDIISLAEAVNQRLSEVAGSVTLGDIVVVPGGYLQVMVTLPVAVVESTCAVAVKAKGKK
jgi:hypothetical protein